MRKSQVRDLALNKALEVLEEHYRGFKAALQMARETGHPVPMDTRGWSQVLVSVLCGIHGANRKKGADLADGSDVKGANTWEAIDTPRFNGVIKAGTQSGTAGRIESLDGMPHLFLVLWDEEPNSKNPRCRIWSVRPQHDREFRKMCSAWYDKRTKGEIISDNFQLHPPRNLNSNTIRNECGNLEYPLLLEARRLPKSGYDVVLYAPRVLRSGVCRRVAG